ncbi:hypothetical protein [Streptomyces sp. NPDC058279]
MAELLGVSRDFCARMGLPDPGFCGSVERPPASARAASGVM